MKNPLNRRIPRDLRRDFGKYFVIFLFITLTIGYVSGDLVASYSMLHTIDESYEKYQTEDGHFTLKSQASEDLLAAVEKKDVTLYPDYYLEETYVGSDGKDKTLRIYQDRTQVNKPCLMEGSLPEEKNQIALDRMYANNNNLEVGGKITLDQVDYEISGLIAMTDYTALFASSSDMMFDAINFSIAIMSPEGFSSLPSQNITYNYAWKYKKGKPEDVVQEKEWSDNVGEALNKAAMKENGGSFIGQFLGLLSEENGIDEFIPAYQNTGMNFAKDDIGGDSGMFTVFLYILIAIMAFIFGVTISHTIRKEATTIGTLRASGYTRNELFWQYLTPPVIVTLLAALIGNILGYTCLKQTIVDLYYNSYSLITYETVWNGSAFVKTTVIPVILMLVITSISLYRKLKLTPLEFFRKEFKKTKRKRAILLPHISFFSRFRIRIILQNISSYLTLFFGIFIASILLLFGLMLLPLLNTVSKEAKESMTSNYQYMLKGEADTDHKDAEKFAMKTCKSHANGYKEEDVTIYGIFPDSLYIHGDFDKKNVYISTGYSEKYKIDIGDKVCFKENFASTLYEFEVVGLIDSPTSLNVYMDQELFTETFDLDEDYYNAYFSNEKLEDIPQSKIYTIITSQDVTKMADQLTHSMGGTFKVFTAFSIILFVLVVYLLTKLILERNALAISMCKILGYTNPEISKLYIMATSLMVLVSIGISYVLITVILEYAFALIMKDYSGALPFSMDPIIYLKAFVLTILSYSLVMAMQMRKIKKVPMTDALKETF
ncbi:MAG: ABC transporter permease [Eubacterium sp.]|nr:ABC transporter permease [Eubacterium sp.]